MAEFCIFDCLRFCPTTKLFSSTDQSVVRIRYLTLYFGTTLSGYVGSDPNGVSIIPFASENGIYFWNLFQVAESCVLGRWSFCLNTKLCSTSGQNFAGNNLGVI